MCSEQLKNIAHKEGKVLKNGPISVQCDYLMPWPGSWERRAEPLIPRQSTAAGTPPS